MTEKIRQPRTVEQATALCERYAQLQGLIALIETKRAEVTASWNADCDKRLEPLIAEAAEIATKVKPWWAKAKADLLTGKRKSMELGGCMIGDKTIRASLQVDADEDGIVAALMALKTKWAKALIRTRHSIDKGATMKALEGKEKEQLNKLGLSRTDPEDKFFIMRAEQSGTMGSGA